MNRNLPIVLSLFLLVGIVVPAYAQTTDHVVINEVDINPPGNDATSISEWIEIYNPTNSDVDLGGWKIASTTVLKKTMTIPDGTIIKPGQFLTYSYQSVWFTDSNESVELRDRNGVVVDKTPLIADIQNDFKSWQRIYDGFDQDISNDWKFATSTAGSSNGKLVETQASKKVTVTASTDKSSYLFGQTLTLMGSVSEEVFIVKPFFQSEPVKVNISGPDYSQSITLYPDLNLNYKTTLNLHQVLGIKEGHYTISVSYAGALAFADFSVGRESFEQITKQDSSLSIVTDKSQYIPGQQVTITGFASEVIPFEGMKLTVKDPEGKIVLNGNLYPTKEKFSTSMFLTTVKPVFGTYEVHAKYSDKSAVMSFEVLQDIKENVPISLWTDKTVYGLGDEVTISGRINQVWISYLDLEVVQTKQSALKNTSGSDSGFKILDGVRVQGDGTFAYKFKIPNNSQRLGDYKINVSKDIGSASIIIHASANPDEFVVSNVPLTVNTDRNVYELGGKITVSGFIKDPQSSPSYTSGTPVKISIMHENGTPLEIIASTSPGRLSTSGTSVGYVFTAIPETSGHYSMQIDVSKNIFTAGKLCS